ncbi:pickpocket protein 28-like isoform X2 [Sitodiplosis mosellana]|uniref:pickpocket protein 28-like isoform X2 n=1 Tax=Sitodiplosis mosellana TaxID=263140 RepID=UPI002444F0D4|nr:pickpocket protein 28-like isoform X2 [Sitodiplosis mosellana]XP_055325781.1 pickpocket protein 28-like isoform X2 [Sitodiplosis mosellana]
MSMQRDTRDVQNFNELKTIRAIFKDFCSNSSIHGVRYLTERRRHWSERLWWIVAFSLSVYFCVSSIHSILINWSENSVNMIMAEKNAMVSTIPFPTVTICVKPKIHLANLNMTKEEDFWKKPFSEKRLTQMEAVEIAPDLSDVVFWCTWRGANFCVFSLSTVITAEGVCFAFNALNSNEIYTEEMAPGMMIVDNNPNVTYWSPEGGYYDETNKEYYPNRIFNAMPGGALNIDFHLSNQDLEGTCPYIKSAYRIFLHMPGEVPNMSRNVIQVAPSEIAEFSIKATYTTTSEGLRSYEPSRRQCFFDSDRQLRFFKFYTQNNCIEECLANFTKQECGCARFFMPRERHTEICGGAKANCYLTAREKLFGEDVVEGLEDENAKSFRKNCQCLPSCTSITYDVVDRTQTFNQLTRTERAQDTEVMIYFKSHDIVTLKRTEAYTVTRILAICGGLLGLFLGVSALSVIEFFYYFTLRLFCNVHRWKLSRVMPFKRKFVREVSNNTLSV